MSGIQMQLVSDLHLEQDHPGYYGKADITVTAPYLALLGDIGNTYNDGLYQFFERMLTKFKLVFFLFGNHEPYGSDWTSAKARMKSFSEKAAKDYNENRAMGQFILLDQKRFDFPDSQTTILGCTLHSHILPEQAATIARWMPDFRQVQGWTTEMHNEAHKSDVSWLNEQVTKISNEEPDRKIVIFSHHNPTTLPVSLDPKFKGSPVASGFSTDLSAELCWTSPLVKTWVFGHTHYNCDFKDEKTGKWVMTNQKGYTVEESRGYDVERVFEL